jgi:DNA-binding response OmpR family regulator
MEHGGRTPRRPAGRACDQSAATGGYGNHRFGGMGKDRRVSHTVLVVEDHAATIELVRQALQCHDIRVSAVANGAECLLAVSRDRPDLIVLDVAMPVMDGFQTLEVLRQSPGGIGIPVIMLTARGSDADVAHGWRLGVTSYIIKPFPISELVLLVTRVLEAEPGARGDDWAEESPSASLPEPERPTAVGLAGAETRLPASSPSSTGRDG